MPRVSELSSAYHTSNDERFNCTGAFSSYRTTISPPGTCCCSLDVLVVSHLIDTERKLAATRATDLAGLRAKAEVIIMAHREDTSALALFSPRTS